MIKINKKDSIIDIIIKIDNCKQKEIILDFPFWHPIIHNYTSLKILKAKVWKKDLIIITTDKNAKKIGKKLGIKYSELWDTDLLEYNYSSIQYAQYLIKRYFLELKQLFTEKTTNITFEYQKKYWLKKSKIWYFLIALLSSIFLFFFIFYFAVNKTYVYITPEITIKTKAENFIFEEATKEEIINNNNIIKLNKISKLIYLTNTFWTSWVNEKSLKRSKWKVMMYNKLDEDVDLLAKTRLETKDGIILQADSSIHIPKATYSSTWAIIPWKTEINVTSKIHTSDWTITWTKANLDEWIILTLPWLKDNKENIYAKTISQISWANEKYQKQLTQEDIENAKHILETKLKQNALNQLKKQIIENNKTNNINSELLWIDWILKYSNFKIIWEKELKIWSNISDFELSWTIKITWYSYNTKKVLNQLSTTIRSNILKNIEKFLFLNEKSLRISNIIYKEEKPLKIKATAEVEAFYSHNFLTKKNNYIQKLKSIISWTKKDEALKILINNPQISDVQIEIRPFFIDTVSKITDNIIIKIKN